MRMSHRRSLLATGEAFPEEPTSWSEVTTLTSSTTYSIPETGWFQVIAIGAGGDGGTAAAVTGGGKWRYISSGGGGGSGGISAIKVAKKKNETIAISISNGDVSISSLGISATAGDAGGAGQQNSAGTGGAGGTATGGDMATQNGDTGSAGSRLATSSWSNTTRAGGAGATNSYSGYTSSGGKGGDAELRYNGNVSTTSPSAGSAAMVVILRGNTNKVA